MKYHQRFLELDRIAQWFIYVGRADEASEWLRQAKLIDSHFNPDWWWPVSGLARFNAQQYDEAIAAFSRSPTLPDWVQAYMAASHALAHRMESARELVTEVLRLSPGFSASRFVAKEPYKRPVDQEHLLDGLRKAGLPE